jgi:hypothetical protein
MAGLVVEDAHAPGAGPQRPPLLMASLIAAVSSVTPSPLAPKALTFLNTLYVSELPLNAAIPCFLMSSSQKAQADAEGEAELLEDEADDVETVLDEEEMLAEDVMLDDEAPELDEEELLAEELAVEDKPLEDEPLELDDADKLVEELETDAEDKLADGETEADELVNETLGKLENEMLRLLLTGETTLLLILSMLDSLEDTKPLLTDEADVRPLLTGETMLLRGLGIDEERELYVDEPKGDDVLVMLVALLP